MQAWHVAALGLQAVLKGGPVCVTTPWVENSLCWLRFTPKGALWKQSVPPLVKPGGVGRSEGGPWGPPGFSGPH